jgi:hypothetical protein
MNAGTLVFAEMYLSIPDAITRLDGFEMKMTRSEFLKELEEMLQTISTQRSDTADRKKELAEFKNLQVIDKGFKAALQEGDYLLSRIESEQSKIIKIINKERDQIT